MASQVEASLHSYEAFAQQPFYRAIDRELVGKAPPNIATAVDIATGTGAIIEDLLDLGKLTEESMVVGLDINQQGLLIARQNLADKPGVHLIRASGELTSIRDGFAELVTIFNSIHLMEPQSVFEEAYRILAPGGLLLVNTAYEKTRATPPETMRFWGLLVVLARKSLKEQHGITDIPPPVELRQHSETDFRQMAEQAGFAEIESSFHTALLDRQALKAICSYGEFASGALPNVQVEPATQALVGVVDSLFERFKIETIPRNWMFLTARKPAY